MDESNTPAAPDSLPNYVADPLARQDVATLRTVIAYCEELIEHYDQEPEPEELAADDAVEDVEQTGGGTIVTKRQKCGADCECNDGKGHGPYRWAVTSDGKGGRDWEYLGKA